MWELLTRDRPFKGLLEGDLVVGVCDRGLRPIFPPGCPASYVTLAQQCWSDDPAQRPTAAQVGCCHHASLCCHVLDPAGCVHTRCLVGAVQCLVWSVKLLVAAWQRWQWQHPSLSPSLKPTTVLRSLVPWSQSLTPFAPCPAFRALPFCV